jgi:integrase
MPNYPGKRKGTRRIVIWARLDGEAKSRPHEWVISGTKREGDEFEARKRIDLNQQRRVELRTAPAFLNFCNDHYRPHAERHLKDSTWRKVRVYQVATLCAHFGPIKMSELAVLDVERYKAVRSKDAGPSSINNELRVFRTVLNYAKTLGVAVPDLKFKKLPIRGHARVKAWTLEQVNALYEAARVLAPDLLQVLVFLVNTGCRKGEAIAAEWSWIDFAANMIRIPSNDYWQPKNGLPREIPMADSIRAILAGPRKHKRWVFPNSHDGRYAEFPKDIYWEVRDEAKLSGGPHTTRHTYASHFLGNVPDLFLLAQILGHSHQRITELYGHMLPEHLAKARNAVNLAPSIQPIKMPKKPDHGHKHGAKAKS